MLRRSGSPRPGGRFRLCKLFKEENDTITHADLSCRESREKVVLSSIVTFYVVTFQYIIPVAVFKGKIATDRTDTVDNMLLTQKSQPLWSVSLIALKETKMLTGVCRDLHL